MKILLSAGYKVNSYAQFMTVLLIFVFVVLITWLTTRYIGNYQKEHSVNRNMHVVETYRLSNNKYVQIIRIGQEYKAIAVCKDTVTYLGDIPADQIVDFEKNDSEGVQLDFKALLDLAKNKRSNNDETK